MTDDPEQPGWIEVGNSINDCGDCGEFLDRVFLYPDTIHQTDWLACPHCGWTNMPDDAAAWQNEWFQNRYRP